MEEYPTNQRYEPQILPQQQNDDTIIYRLETKDIIDRFEHRLKGEFLVEVEEVDEETKKKYTYKTWQADELARILNDAGAKAITNALESMLNKIIFLSNVDDETIMKVCNQIHGSIAREIYDGWVLFDVKRNPGPIIVQMMHTIFLGLKRAQGGGERNALKEIHTVNEVIMPDRGGRRHPFGGGDK